MAPYYYCYRRYYSHLDCTVLADIPNFPFHYAKYLYGRDGDIEFATIGSSEFYDPLVKLMEGRRST